SSHQFARNLGGTVGVGVCGSLVVHQIDQAMASLMSSSLRADLPPELAARVATDIQDVLRPEFTESLSGPAMTALRTAIGRGVQAVFWTSLLVCVTSLILCVMLPRSDRRRP
ncbi:MAG: MFS transporter, partial [Nitrospirota bacterium]